MIFICIHLFQKISHPSTAHPAVFSVLAIALVYGQYNSADDCVGRVSSSYPSRGPSRSHDSDVAPVDKDQQAGPVPHVAPADGWQRRWRLVDYGLVEIK